MLGTTRGGYNQDQASLAVNESLNKLACHKLQDGQTVQSNNEVPGVQYQKNYTVVTNS